MNWKHDPMHHFTKKIRWGPERLGGLLKAAQLSGGRWSGGVSSSLPWVAHCGGHDALLIRASNAHYWLGTRRCSLGVSHQGHLALGPFWDTQLFRSGLRDALSAWAVGRCCHAFLPWCCILRQERVWGGPPCVLAALPGSAGDRADLESLTPRHASAWLPRDATDAGWEQGAQERTLSVSHLSPNRTFHGKLLWWLTSFL